MFIRLALISALALTFGLLTIRSDHAIAGTSADSSIVNFDVDPDPPYSAAVGEFIPVTLTATIGHSANSSFTNGTPLLAVLAANFPGAPNRFNPPPGAFCFMEGSPLPCGEGDPAGVPTTGGTTCFDGIDNDADTLVDELDPECQTAIDALILTNVAPAPGTVATVSRVVALDCWFEGEFPGGFAAAVWPLPQDPDLTNNIAQIEGTLDCAPVRIDIKPFSDPNAINPDNEGNIPVAILSNPMFDAAQVDTTSLTFGATGDEDSLLFCGAALEDANGDAFLDLVCHFDTQKTGFQCGDTEGLLRGQLLDGTPIHGSDAVKIVPC